MYTTVLFDGGMVKFYAVCMRNRRTMFSTQKRILQKIQRRQQRENQKIQRGQQRENHRKREKILRIQQRENQRKT